MSARQNQWTATLCAAALLAGGPVLAAPSLQLNLPATAHSTAQRSEALASYRLAVGPFAAGASASQTIEGGLEQTAWQIKEAQGPSLALMQPLRGQIAAAGFTVIFECETEACGGYDFRYGMDVLPEPAMHVDLGDFRYLAAERTGAAGKEYLSLLVSRSSQNGYVQLTRIGGASVDVIASTKSAEPAAPLPVVAETAEKPAAVSVATGDLGKLLDLGQAQVLEDLVFASGSSALAAGDYASLRDLAAWLKADAARGVTLVGHTDASGGLAGNIALSKKRAESVRQALIKGLGVAAAQVVANGVGPLAPRASNLTPEGQQQNRRVEVVPTPTP